MYLIFPQCDRRHIFRIVHIFFSLFVRNEGYFADSLRYRIHHILIIGVIALDDRDAGVLLVVMGIHPQAESGEGRGQCRHTECQTFERRISPRLVIRREQCQVQTDEQVIVLHIEDTVIAVQI